MAALSTQVKADWLQRLGLEEGRDYRLYASKELGLHVHFTTQATVVLLDAIALKQVVGRLVEGVGVEACNVHLNLQVDLRPKMTLTMREVSVTVRSEANSSAS